MVNWRRSITSGAIIPGSLIGDRDSSGPAKIFCEGLTLSPIWQKLTTSHPKPIPALI